MELSHVDESGRIKMVDVAAKPVTERMAVAKGEVVVRPDTLCRITKGDLPKGDVLVVAQIAGTMAAKRTADLIPLCHHVLLTGIDVTLRADKKRSVVDITATAHSQGRTGVEMEALTAVSVAALTLYDMIKAVEKAARIDNIRLIEKHGGKSGSLVLEAAGEDDQ